MPKYRTKWSRAAVEQAAAQCQEKIEFREKFSGAYAAAFKDGYLDEVTAHMSLRQVSWDYEKVKAEAQKYEVKDHFIRACAGGAKWAKRHGFFDEICFHMVPQARSDFDAVYLWKLRDFGDVYKVGVTSHRLGDARIKFVSAMSGYDVEYYFVVKSDRACEIETQMLKLGRPFHGVSCSGMTEFREFTPQELSQCLQMMGLEPLKEFA